MLSGNCRTDFGEGAKQLNLLRRLMPIGSRGYGATGRTIKRLPALTLATEVYIVTYNRACSAD
jgi:hypothetical protein